MPDSATYEIREDTLVVLTGRSSSGAVEVPLDEIHNRVSYKLPAEISFSRKRDPELVVTTGEHRQVFRMKAEEMHAMRSDLVRRFFKDERELEGTRFGFMTRTPASLAIGVEKCTATCKGKRTELFPTADWSVSDRELNLPEFGSFRVDKKTAFWLRELIDHHTKGVQREAKHAKDGWWDALGALAVAVVANLLYLPGLLERARARGGGPLSYGEDSSIVLVTLVGSAIGLKATRWVRRRLAERSDQ